MKLKDITADQDYLVSTRSEWATEPYGTPDRYRVIEVGGWEPAPYATRTPTVDFAGEERPLYSGRRNPEAKKHVLAVQVDTAGTPIPGEPARLLPTGQVRAPWKEGYALVNQARAWRSAQEEEMQASAQRAQDRAQEALDALASVGVEPRLHQPSGVAITLAPDEVLALVARVRG